jgi:hypothetical protein
MLALVASIHAFLQQWSLQTKAWTLATSARVTES